ncbi:putative bifunctional diguanylate cyclase/phosphodiesterase [Micromonosporaceae bacterium Da 78-11]
MNGAVLASWLGDAWRRRRAAVLLVAGVAVVLVVALAVGSVRGYLIGAAVFLLDVLGAVVSWRAARRVRAGGGPWRLIAAGRAAAVVTTVCLVLSTVGQPKFWWWTGAGARLLMFVLLAVGVLTVGMRQFHGRSRRALLAEVVTVLAAGFMVTWYFALEPIFTTQRPSGAWLTSVGWPVGDLLLLAAMASVVLRGAVRSFAGPIAVFAAGLAVYFAADVTWSAIESTGTVAANSPAAGVSMVVAGLLLTVAPMLVAAEPGRDGQAAAGTPPAWATHLPMASMLVGCLLMLVVTLLEGELLRWGGLICGLIVMTCAAALRQMDSLRDSRERIIADPLTGLANRVGLDQALDRSVRRGEPMALLLLDLDGFKLVNDAYGHAAGDVFLAQVGHQLRSSVRSGQVPARIGGDEFAVLLPGITTTEQTTGVAQRILTTLSGNPVRIDEDTVPVRASIGVALAEPGDDGKALLRHADLAMYHSKRAGSHGFTLYYPSMVDRRAADAALAEDLEHALRRGELRLLYQPIVDLGTGRPIAAEALIRWEHPVHGLMSPVRFIPIAERSGAIIEIGLWVLEQALRELLVLRRELAPGEPLHMSVNLSPRQLAEPTIVHDVLGVVTRAGAEPRDLALEVTESGIVEGGRRCRRAARPARPRHPHGDRRLRHRVLVAAVPDPAAGRHPQDRPQFRRRARRHPGGRRGDRGDHPALPGAAPVHGRRGDRDRGTGRRVARARLPARPGPSVRAAAAAGGDARVAGRHPPPGVTQVTS